MFSVGFSDPKMFHFDEESLSDLVNVLHSCQLMSLTSQEVSYMTAACIDL